MKRSIANSFSLASKVWNVSLQNHAPIYELTPPVMSAEQIVLTRSDIAKLIDLVSSHPNLDMMQRMEALKDTIETYGLSPALERTLVSKSSMSRDFLSYFLKSMTIQSTLNFVHVDIIARRESKSEVTLLVDLQTLDRSNLGMFFLCPVDQNLILSPRVSGKRLWASSLEFNNLATNVQEDLPISATCTSCLTTSTFDSPENYLCSNLKCDSSTPPPPPHDIHPGGNRRYFGPVVPNIGRVWIGVTEKYERRTDRVGLIKATVYCLFHDQADVNRRGRIVRKFPTASPRIQWAIFPYK